MRKNDTTIIMRDGSRVDVTHAQGAHIQAVLMGEREPENEKQRAFIANVKRVVFRPVKTNTAVGRPVDRPRTPIDDAELLRIRNDETLTGLEKLRATMDYIRNR